MRAIYLESEKSIVTVASIRQETDWFDNPILSTGQYAGIILAINPSEVVILTGEKAVEEADSLGVIFGDGSTASVEVKQRDTIAGMAAIRVKTADIGEQTLNWIQAASLGNSYSVRPGDMILAVGSPTGHVHSVITGMISYVAKGVQVADGQTRMLYTDFDGDGDRGVFLLNLSGQLIGWVTEQMEAEETAGASLAMPISEYKWMLEQQRGFYSLLWNPGPGCKRFHAGRRNSPGSVYYGIHRGRARVQRRDPERRHLSPLRGSGHQLS